MAASTASIEQLRVEMTVGTAPWGGVPTWQTPALRYHHEVVRWDATTHTHPTAREGEGGGVGVKGGVPSLGRGVGHGGIPWGAPTHGPKYAPAFGAAFPPVTHAGCF